MLRRLPLQLLRRLLNSAEPQKRLQKIAKLSVPVETVDTPDGAVAEIVETPAEIVFATEVSYATPK